MTSLFDAPAVVALVAELKGSHTLTAETKGSQHQHDPLRVTLTKMGDGSWAQRPSGPLAHGVPTYDYPRGTTLRDIIEWWQADAMRHAIVRSVERDDGTLEVHCNYTVAETRLPHNDAEGVSYEWNACEA